MQLSILTKRIIIALKKFNSTCKIKNEKLMSMNIRINFVIHLVFFIALSFKAQSQLNNPDFIRGGLDDAQILFKEYLTPWANCLGSNINGGWYNTAETHEPLGFDITLSINTAWAPLSSRTFEISNLNLNGQHNGITTAPTIAGKPIEGRPVLSYYQTNPLNGEQVTVAEYEVPDGTGLHFLPLPVGQLGIGLPFGTEITGRFLPDIALGNAGNIGLWGAGLKHSISQWLPVFKNVPFLNISAQGGYTRMLAYANLYLRVDDDIINRVTNPLIFKGQKIEVDLEAYTINLIASQNFLGVGFYQGIGYSTSTACFRLKGNFPVARLETDESDEDYGNIVVTDNDIYNDPFKMEIQNTENLRINAGIRFKLGLLTLHFDYTRANYNIFTAGLGISFR